jgi:serine/threonine protein phosphatase PrpC
MHNPCTLLFVSTYAGDSVALLARGGACQRLTVDHRADNAAEMLRVLNAGGELEYDECGTLRLYRPTDAERRNGCMFTRCGKFNCWGVCCLLCVFHSRQGSE